MRGFFAAFLSLLLTGAGLACFARTFDWHRPAPPPPHSCDPVACEWPVLHPDAPYAKMPDWAKDWLERSAA